MFDPFLETCLVPEYLKALRIESLAFSGSIFLLLAFIQYKLLKNTVAWKASG